MSTPARSRRTGPLGRLAGPLRLMISLGLLTYVCARADWAAIMDQVRTAVPSFLVLFLLVTPLNVAISVRRWQVILQAQGHRVGFGRLFAIYVIGQFYNNLLPSAVGGDVVRAVAVNRDIDSGMDALGSIIVERFCGLTVLVGLALAAVVMAPPLRSDPQLMLGITLGLIIYGVVLAAVLSHRPIEWLQWALGRLGAAGGAVAKLERFHDSLRRCRDQRGTLLRATAWSVLFYAGAIANVYLACRMLRSSPDLLAVAQAAPVVMLISMLPITLGGLGLTEWAFVESFAVLGMPPIGLTVALLLRLKVMVWSAAGYLMTTLFNATRGVTAAVSDGGVPDDILRPAGDQR